MNQTRVKAEAVTKRFGDVVAVDGVSLSVLSGDIYSLVGANGAGKSTLIRAIAGISDPDSGRILICDDDISHNTPAAKKRVGYLPEELIFYDQLTGGEFLKLVAGLKESDPALIKDELDFFELTEVANKLVGGYSLGMRKKLGLAAAMLGSPDVLVLDEPLNGLDVEMMRRVRLRLASERESGKAVLVSSHVMSFVERISNRVGVMKAGRLVAEGSPLELRTATGLNTEPFEDVFFHLTA